MDRTSYFQILDYMTKIGKRCLHLYKFAAVTRQAEWLGGWGAVL